MNRSKIEWCDHTWNPITGCLHNCEYCYARRMTARFAGDIRLNKMCAADYRTEETIPGEQTLYILDNPMKNETGKNLVYPFGFEPTLHKYRLNSMDSLKMGNNIFVCAMADLFGDWVPDIWIDKVMEVAISKPQHNWLFLTKNPDRYFKYGVPTQGYDNMWYGTTITKETEIGRLNSLPAFGKTFASIEPILEDIEPEKHTILFDTVNWIILGAETGNLKNKIVPKFDWIKKIVLEADNHGIPIFMKDSLVEVVGEFNMRRDFPPELKRKTLSEKLHNKLYDRCCECNSLERKNDMITLLGRAERGVQPKQFGFMCPKCFSEFCKSHNLEIPKFKNMEEETDGKEND